MLFSFIFSVPVDVPAGMALFPNDLLIVPRSLSALKYRNIVHFSTFDEGGHFPALEYPSVLAAEIRAFVKKVETLKLSKED